MRSTFANEMETSRRSAAGGGRIAGPATAFALACGILLSSGGNADADQRSYVWTYEYSTLEQGEAEIESYFTLSTPDQGKMEGQTTAQHQVEIEIGMTDRFDIGIYQVFSQAPGEAMQYEGFKLRARYRIGEKGEYWLDPLIYAEYKGMPDFAEHEMETKLVLARDFDRFRLALNPTLEFKFGGEEEEVEAAYAAGIRYRVNDLLRVGLEAKGGEGAHYVGPVIAHGGERFWTALGTAFHVGDVDPGKAEFEVRLLLGIGL